MLDGVRLDPATNDIKGKADQRSDRQRQQHTPKEQHRNPKNDVGGSDLKVMEKRLVNEVGDGGGDGAGKNGPPIAAHEPMCCGRQGERQT